MPTKLLIVSTVSTTIEAFLLPFARHYRDRGWRVDALAAGAPGSESCRKSFDVVWEANWSRTPLDVSGNLGSGRYIRKLVNEQRYDLVHVHTPVASFVTRAALRNCRRTKVIYTAHGFHFFEGGAWHKNLIFSRAEKIAGRWTDALVVINREDELAAKRYGIVDERRLFYMPGIGIDLERYSAFSIGSQEAEALRNELQLEAGKQVLLMVAEMIPRKRHADALRAFSELGNEAVFLLAGDGPLRGQLEELARRLGVKERVRFLGVRSDVPKLMKLANAVVLVSSQEGLPRSGMEAMAMGKPVIGTDIRGTRDLVYERGGLLAPVGNVESIAFCMEKLLDNPDLAGRMGAAGREQVKQYDLKRVIQLHDELYDKVLATDERGHIACATQVPKVQAGFAGLAKACFDRVGAAGLLVVLSPVLAVIALLVRMRLGSPVLFRQRRPGKNEKIFELVKFRTMTNEQDGAGRLLPDEARLTRLGKWLRSLSLDELPQLWNVVRGELSFVGPRPLLVQYLERYTPEQARRHAVKPGITGWAQVNGRNAISWEEKFALDTWYVDHWDLWLDARILALTVWRVVRRDGISQEGRATMTEFQGTEEKKLTADQRG
ncbi:MAG TPA: sugar transferase [Candidatus Angelobacter sp.]|nr:sugar transferase [Candidatus Angelobacter sp.]